MGKLLLWAILVLLVLIGTRLWTRGWAARQAREERAQQQSSQTPGGSPTAAEPMVRCAWCGVHVPRSEALVQHGQFWCCAEHARLGATKQP